MGLWAQAHIAKGVDVGLGQQLSVLGKQFSVKIVEIVWKIIKIPGFSA